MFNKQGSPNRAREEEGEKEQSGVVSEWALYLAMLLLCFGLATFLLGHSVNQWEQSKALQPTAAPMPSGAATPAVPRTMDGEIIKLPPPGTRVTLYKRRSFYHWYPDCPDLLNPKTGEIIAVPLRTVTRDQADAQGRRTCPICGDPDAFNAIVKSREETRSELRHNPIHLRPLAQKR